jgi:hypothetical protein
MDGPLIFDSILVFAPQSRRGDRSVPPMRVRPFSSQIGQIQLRSFLRTPSFLCSSKAGYTLRVAVGQNITAKFLVEHANLQLSNVDDEHGVLHCCCSMPAVLIARTPCHVPTAFAGPTLLLRARGCRGQCMARYGAFVRERPR